MNNNKPPQKSPKNWEKQAFLTLLKQCQTHQKQTFIILKPQKNQTQNTPFAMLKHNPLFFINFLFFSTYSFCFWNAVFCWKHYKNSVFSKAQLFKNTVSKTHFFTHVKKTPFSQKRCHFWFWAISAETTIFIVFPGLHCFGPKKILAKTDSVHENARFFLPYWHK